MMLYDDEEMLRQLTALGARLVPSNGDELVFEITPESVDAVAALMRDELDAIIRSLEDEADRVESRSCPQP